VKSLIFLNLKFNYINKIHLIKINLFNFIFFTLLGIIIFISGYHFSKFGLDLTDTGFFLYLQNNISHGKINDIGLLSLTCGSDIVGAIWLNIFQKNPELIFARLGAFLIVYLICIFLFFILFEISKNKWLSAFLVVFIYLLWPGIKSFPILNYDLVPLLPLSIFFYLFILTKKNNYNFNLLNILIGFTSCILIFTRLPLFLPVIIILGINIYFEKAEKHEIYKKYFIGFVLALFFLMLIPICRNYFIHSYLNLMKISNGDMSLYYKLNSDSNYGITTQLYFWIRGYVRILIIIILILFLAFLNKKLVKYLNDNFLKGLIISIILSITFFFNKISDVLGYDYLQFYNNFFNYILESIFLVICLLILINKKNEYREITLFALIFFVFYPVGSNSFEKKLILSAPIFFIPIYLIYLKNTNLNSLYLKIENHFDLKYIIKIIGITYIISSIVNLYNFIPYRESAIYELSKKIQTKGLKNIQTTEERYEAVMPLYNWLNNTTNSKNTLLCLDRTSLLNYTLQLDGVFDYPWPLLLDNNFFSNRLNNLDKENKAPDYIVIPLIDMSIPNWEKQKPPFKLDDFHNKYFSMYLLKYSIVYKSEYFSVWKNIKTK
jgi:hypothetical protein